MKQHRVDVSGQESVLYACSCCGKLCWIDTEDGSELTGSVICVTCSEDLEDAFIVKEE